MTHILHIDSSPRGDRSISRSLTKTFVDQWQAAHPDDTVTYRDLGHQPVPHVDEPWIAASFSPPDQLSPDLKAALQVSDELIDELFAADLLVFGVPMYNLTVPSTLKAYIDQIVRVGRTFAVNENGYQGLVHGKRMLVFGARGNEFPPDSPMAAYDFHTPYIRSIFGFIGITDIQFVNADGVNTSEETRQKYLQQAHEAIEQLVAA
ncbi:FMN-dependent NADH-azoreductase [Microcoleus sp. FACHB-1515]|uniref:FMN-dependent NADH-azoreductase n=1 Tax=Cyanophyceae TaxID=3028117 RepID=UPI0016878F49|nr:FMN-dependent NADH-azoreductase [Microcoleus sp. FACHB-1515]MBD2088723.1 FMN-dependent NADH-azoreductase [Microcoleus sp. FACHB-1515]